MNPPPAIAVRAATAQDAPALAEIYNWYTLNTVVTFEETPVGSDQMLGRMRFADASCPWLVAEQGQTVVGFACAAPWKPREAYRHSRETSIYLRSDAVGQGVGELLYGRLLESLRQAPVHVLIAGIALPNPASVALHEKLGFVPVGSFTEVGCKFGRYVDVGYWQATVG